MSRKFICGVIGGLALSCLLCVCVWAVTDKEKNDLAGLEGVLVLVEDLSEACKGKLTQEQLTTDVELRLRKAGINVLSNKEWLATNGHPYLYIWTAVVASRVGKIDPALVGYSYAMGVDLKQDVLSARKGHLITGASTWHAKGSVGMAPPEEMPAAIRGCAGDMVDAFINAYLAANPKK